MVSRRYTILVADRSSGVMRRATVSVRPVIAGVCAVLALPILMKCGTITHGDAAKEADNGK